MNIHAPEKCLVCGAGWIGGHCSPGDPMQDGLRIFFWCGASMSVKPVGAVDGIFHILFKNCWAEKMTKEEVKGSPNG